MTIARDLLGLDPRIRYVAVNRGGVIEEMLQSGEHLSFNPPETDRMEELLVNPVALELFTRRGNLDLGGVRFFSSCATVCSSRSSSHVRADTFPSESTRAAIRFRSRSAWQPR